MRAFLEPQPITKLFPTLGLSPLELGFEGSSFHTSKDYGNSVDMPQLNDRRLE